MYFSILKSLKAVLYNMCNNILKVYPKIGCLTAHHSPPQDRLLDTVLNRVSFLSFFLFLSGKKKQQFNENQLHFRESRLKYYILFYVTEQ